MIRHPVLDQLSETGIKLGLERVKAFLDFLGEPHRAFPVVHVAGTNGKGSVCTYITEALVAAGYRVGTNLSPHLETINERFRIDGQPIDDPTLSDAIEALDRARWDWSSQAGIQENPLTYFEFTTVLAFQLFAQHQVDVAVIEVGMGGRLDATNVVSPQVCAITSIAWDHQEHLGDSLAAIAGEKAGILKKGIPVVIGVLPPPAREAIETRAKALACPLWRPGQDMAREARQGRWNFKTPLGYIESIALGMEGQHQGANALVAFGVLHQLRQQGFVIVDDAIRTGFERARLPGRIEQILPGLILDGAHNEEGTTALAAWLKTRPRPKNRILLFGAGLDRDPLKIIEPLLAHVDEVVTTQAPHLKARDSFELAKYFQELDIALSDGGPIAEALPEIYAEANETIVVGSLYLVGAARSLINQGLLEGISPGQAQE